MPHMRTRPPWEVQASIMSRETRGRGEGARPAFSSEPRCIRAAGWPSWPSTDEQTEVCSGDSRVIRMLQSLSLGPVWHR